MAAGPATSGNTNSTNAGQLIANVCRHGGGGGGGGATAPAIPGASHKCPALSQISIRAAGGVANTGSNVPPHYTVCNYKAPGEQARRGDDGRCMSGLTSSQETTKANTQTTSASLSAKPASPGIICCSLEAPVSRSLPPNSLGLKRLNLMRLAQKYSSVGPGWYISCVSALS